MGSRGPTEKVQPRESLSISFADNGIKTGIIGTIGHRLFGKPVAIQDGRTTPESSTMQSLLRSWNDQGMSSSCDGSLIHWSCLESRRRYSILRGLFYQFSRDHLDFHSSMDEYLKAKRRLFVDLVDEDSTCILNADDHACIKTPTTGRTWGFSTDRKPEIYATGIHAKSEWNNMHHSHTHRCNRH